VPGKILAVTTAANISNNNIIAWSTNTQQSANVYTLEKRGQRGAVNFIY